MEGACIQISEIRIAIEDNRFLYCFKLLVKIVYMPSICIKVSCLCERLSGWGLLELFLCQYFCLCFIASHDWKVHLYLVHDLCHAPRLCHLRAGCLKLPHMLLGCCLVRRYAFNLLMLSLFPMPSCPP